MNPQHSILLCVVVLLLTITQSYAACQGDLVKLDNKIYSAARCLDGSPGAFYFSKAKADADINKWTIMLEGGGECVTKSTCLSRAKGALGSSIGYPDQANHNMFQTCETANPFANYNKVYIKYCSGDLFYGQDDIKNDRAYGLQFSGVRIVTAVVDELLKNYNLAAAELVVLGGYSAGGLGAMNIGDEIFDRLYVRLIGNTKPYQIAKRNVYLQAEAAEPTTLRGPIVAIAPVAGYHFETNPVYPEMDLTPNDPKPIEYIPWKFTPDWSDYLTLWNSTIPYRCARFGGIPKAHCLIAQGSYNTTVTPVFAVQSTIDPTVLPLHGGLPEMWSKEGDEKSCYADDAPCNAKVRKYMQIWSGNITQHLAVTEIKHLFAPSVYPQLFPQGTTVPMDGAFGSACLTHTGFGVTAPLVDGLNYKQALDLWLHQVGQVNAGIQQQTTAVNEYYHVDKCKPGDILCGKCKA